MYRVGRWRLYLAMAVAILLESNLIWLFSIKGTTPSITLILIIFVGLYSDWQETLEASALGGLLRGIFTMGPVGISVAVYVFCGILAVSCKNKVYKNSFFTQAVVTLAIAAVYNSITLFATRLGKNAELAAVGLGRPFISLILTASLYTAVAAPFVFFVLKRSLKVSASEF